MFYQFCDDVESVEIDDIPSNNVVAGYVTLGELENVYDKFGFARSTVDACKSAGNSLRSNVEVYDDYSFATLKLINAENVEGKKDCVGLYIKKHLLVVVDIADEDGSIRNKFFDSLKKYSCINITTEKLAYAFLDNLVSQDNRVIENTEFEIARLEELVLKDKASENFNLMLLQIKKELLILRNGYEQLIDIGEALEDNENEVFEEKDLRYLSNFTDKVKRLREDIDMLRDSVNHLQDAYSSYLDLKLNHTMQVFTLITTIFFPLTLIVGWYGMNFKNMPELSWKYGYLFVILLSVAVVAILTFIFKKKKWL